MALLAFMNYRYEPIVCVCVWDGHPVLYAFSNVWYCATYVSVWLRTHICVGVFKYALWKISEHFSTVLFFSTIMYSSSTYDVPPKLHSIFKHNLPRRTSQHIARPIVWIWAACRVSSLLSVKLHTLRNRTKRIWDPSRIFCLTHTLSHLYFEKALQSLHVYLIST